VRRRQPCFCLFGCCRLRRRILCCRRLPRRRRGRNLQVQHPRCWASAGALMDPAQVGNSQRALARDILDIPLTRSLPVLVNPGPTVLAVRYLLSLNQSLTSEAILQCGRAGRTQEPVGRCTLAEQAVCGCHSGSTSGWL